MAVFIALVHFPVIDKNEKTVTTSVTNFDIHDISRCAKTYGVRRFYLVTPVPSQQWFAKRIIRHWTEGFGAEYNPTRQEAMGVISLANDLVEVVDEITKETGRSPIFIATSAKSRANMITYKEMREKISGAEEDYCILFGTGWGLHASVLEEVDYFLEPITGTGDYNHLSVRSAVAITLDRLFGR
jgi:hypothetical protein